MRILKSFLNLYTYIFLLTSTSAFATRGPGCEELGNCSSSPNLIMGLVWLYIIGTIIFGGIKESFQKRGLKGPIAILIMPASLVITFINRSSWGVTPCYISFAIAFTSVWWLSPLMDHLFPEDMKNNQEMSDDKNNEF